MSDMPLLTLEIVAPLLGALGAIALPRIAGWAWALTLSLAGLALAIYLIVQFPVGAAGFQLTERYTWLPEVGVNYTLGLDGINLFLIGLNALLTVLAVGASWQIARDHARSREYFTLMLLLSAGMQGVFLSTNLFLFYVFWEVMLIPAYLLIGIFGGPRRAYAAIKFVLYTTVGSLLMLVGILAVGALASGNGRPYTLDLPALLSAGVPKEAQLLLFLAFSAAFAVKAGLFPFHNWAPDAYAEAPAAVVVLVAGVMAKTGAYGFLRFCLPLFPDGAKAASPAISILAVIGILYFAVQALVAQDFQRLLAYVSLSHMGVILLAIFAFNVQGLEGALVQMVNHGVIIAALFILAAAIEARTGSRTLADFGGLATRLPWLATAFLIASLAALGLPGLNSFAGEFLAFLGAFHANIALGALATAVVVPAAWYMLRFFQGVMMGPAPTTGAVAASLAATGRRKGGQRLLDLRWGEGLVLAPLIALIFFFGLFPGLLTARMEQPISAISARYGPVAASDRRSFAASTLSAPAFVVRRSK